MMMMVRCILSMSSVLRLLLFDGVHLLELLLSRRLLLGRHPLRIITILRLLIRHKLVLFVVLLLRIVAKILILSRDILRLETRR